MFWSGNYIVVRELNFLLKEENVSLSQVLEADDILQECKADNKALIQFLTKPEILAELITLITEEPPKNVELASQYRHASIACEVLTSHLSMLSDRLSLDSVQMNRLCDFINKDPPLNPLLASYFSKTIEMLLERSPKQDWYLYHIVCLRVLDFFKSRRDFLPNLLRHLATSAIADTFKYFIRLDDLFNKIIMEWLEEHQFLESLIQIICGAHVTEPMCAPAPPCVPPGVPPGVPPAPTPSAPPESADLPEKGEREPSEKVDVNHKEADKSEDDQKATNSVVNNVEESSGADEGAQLEDEPAAAARLRSARTQAVASANAAGLLCDIILNGCAGEGCTTRPRTSWVLMSRLQSEEAVRLLLQSIFTSAASARRHAVVNGCQVLLALLSQEPILAGECDTERTSVELAVAPHLPLLHQALLHHPEHHHHHTHTHASEADEGLGLERRVDGACVGAARVHVAALLAQLALSEVEEVPTTMLTLGTPGALLDLFFQFPDNNFLHAQVYALVKHALANRVYRTQYANHLIVECDLLTRLMDVFEENGNKKVAGAARSGYMGHVVLALRRLARALDPAESELAQHLGLSEELLARWTEFLDTSLRPALEHHDTPLGGYYPSENIYEAENMADSMAASYEFNDMATTGLDELGEDIGVDDINEVCGAGGGAGAAGGGGEGEVGDRLDDDPDKMSRAENSFLELASQRFDDDMWEDTPEHELFESREVPPHALTDVLGEVSPWETGGAEASPGGESWAQFGGDAFAQPPADPFAHPAAPPATHLQPGDGGFAPFVWPGAEDGQSAAESGAEALQRGMLGLRLLPEPARAEPGLPDAALDAELVTSMRRWREQQAECYSDRERARARRRLGAGEQPAHRHEFHDARGHRQHRERQHAAPTAPAAALAAPERPLATPRRPRGRARRAVADGTQRETGQQRELIDRNAVGRHVSIRPVVRHIATEHVCLSVHESRY